MPFELKLYKDHIAPLARVAFPASPAALQVCYLVSGGLRLDMPGFASTLGANSAFLATQPIQSAGGTLDSVALRWELSAAGAASVPLEGEDVSSDMLLCAPIEIDRSKEYLLRCDRVDFPPKGEALAHTHQGGGIRCLLFGGIEIETMDKRHSYGPLGAWFEAGPQPVYAAASATEHSAFARVMVLPRSLLGKSSIAYVNVADIAKPKSQRYQVFVDTPVELPLY